MARNEDGSDRLVSFFIAVFMVATGSLNTISVKWVDQLSFDHPVFQTICMFFGEFCCLIVYLIMHFIRKRQWRMRNQFLEGSATFDLDLEDEPILLKFNPLIFLPPACCDMLGTSIMYVGLNLTSASSYQMLRGSVIIFTGLLSTAFLRTHLRGFRWLGMGLVALGLLVVGCSDIEFDTNPNDDLNGIITGNLLIVMAQIVIAIQMVTEQKLVLEYDVPPLLAVGLEGLFGMIILFIFSIPMYYIHVPTAFSKNPEHRLEDLFYAFKQINEKPIIILALFLVIVSIAFFNFAGVTVTKNFSATSRMVLDSVRTFVIWFLSIPLFGEKFIAVQLIGFALLTLGMFIYNDLLIGPWFRREILPKIHDERFALCLASFCGIGLPEGGNNRFNNHERFENEE
ncbi:Solute carrier family 35 member F6 [Meloidogyne graminicola]|uniref:Solute carrier family 35 member F6 n=1 Tax=Meloidogyne graminicola TaxID=189291 RepID=A0A8S9ZY57_9BILA|nr:Solute carrier family 35 member F6 [Meloidogyne graminicola]